MSHQCPFPVRSTDSRGSYRAGTAPGFILSLTLIAVLTGYASLSDAAPAAPAQAKQAAVSNGESPVSKGGPIGWAKGRLLVAPRAGLSDARSRRP